MLGGLRKHIYSQHGAVTLYLLIIFVAVFFLSGILVDYARIFAAEKEMQNATQASVRSVMAHYDANLQNYGLYAIDLQAASMQKLYKTVMDDNLSSSITEGHFSLIDTRCDSAEVIVLNNLGERDWLEKQIIDEMKVKGPAEAGLTIIQSVQGLIAGVSQYKKGSVRVPKTEGLAKPSDEELAQKKSDAKVKADEQLKKLGKDVDEWESFQEEMKSLSRNDTEAQATYTELTKKLSDHSDKPEWWYQLWENVYYNFLKNILGPLADLYNGLVYGVKLGEKLASIVANPEEFYNEIYVNEYAFMHFNSFLKGGYPDHKDKHRIPREEVEFIIYGRLTPGANFEDAIKDIMYTRIVANLLDIASDGDIEPISAALYTFFMSCADMIQLLMGERVPFFHVKPCSLSLGYEDYLRLRMLLTSKEDKLTRMQALIEINLGKVNKTDYSISKPVNIQGHSTGSVRLLFLPGIVKALNRVGVLQGKLVDGNRYRIDTYASMYY